MPLLSQLVSDYNPFGDEEPQDPALYGDEDEERYPRSKVRVSDEVGRRVLQKEQPLAEGKSVGQFFENLGSDVGEFAHGVAGIATYPIFHPQATAEALIGDTVGTAKKFAGAMVEGYKESYTPQEGESVPGMILRRFYEKPFTTLMDASALGQAAFGGAGLAARAATAGVRGAAEGAAIARSVGETMAGRAFEAAPELAETARKAASADRVIDLMARATERAKRIDPINLAIDTGKAVLKSRAPDRLAELNTVSQVTDAMAERTVVMRAAEDERTARVGEAFGELNTAERGVIWPYISGRLNMEAPLGPALMQNTGEWVPLKGEVIRPEALEAARQRYIPIQQEYEFKQGLTPEQAGAREGERAMNEARQILGKDEFDPLHPEVQEYVNSEATKAAREATAVIQKRAAGEMMTSLDIAKEKAFRAHAEESVAANLHASIEDAESALPRPERTTVEEALRAMGPQGGIYFPHSAEAYTRDQSTIKNVLTKMGEALPYKENEQTLFASGVMENQDPVKQLLRSYATYDQNKTWLQMGYDAAEQGVKDGLVERMEPGWQMATDPDVLKGTHQPFHPGKMIADDMATEDVQRLFTRMMEVSDETGPQNIFEVMQGITDNAEKGPLRSLRQDVPIYKIPTSMGKALKSIKEQFEPTTNPLLRMTDKFTQWWNWANLNLRLTRINNNVIGNSFFAVMQGVHPFTPRGLTSLVAMGRALASKVGLGGEEGTRLAKVFDLPGVRSGGLYHELESLPSTLDKAGQTIGERMAESRIPGIAATGRWSERLARYNQNIESAFRGASLFYELSPNAIGRAQRILGHAADTMTLGEKIESFAKSGAEVTMKSPEYRGALKSVNRFFHDYDRTTPFERSTIRRIFPYYKFWKHSTDLITKYPFEHPLKGAVMRTLGQAAIRDTKDTLKQWGLDWDRDVPTQLKDAFPVSVAPDPTTGKPLIYMFNAKGPNPFSQMTGLQAEQFLGMLSPTIKIAMEQSTGINLFKRERYRGALSSFSGREVDENGNIVESYEHPSFPEAFLRSFWPYQIVKEMVAQGRVPLDTTSLLDMVTKSPAEWAQLEVSGKVRMTPGKHNIDRPLARFVGPVPSYLTTPTKQQKQQSKGIVNEQLRNLMQRFPDRRAEIMDAIRQTSREVQSERR